jgi:hypothetical protein
VGAQNGAGNGCKRMRPYASSVWALTSLFFNISLSLSLYLCPCSLCPTPFSLLKISGVFYETEGLRPYWNFIKANKTVLQMYNHETKKVRKK